jgi:hypothetical protein
VRSFPLSFPFDRVDLSNHDDIACQQRSNARSPAAAARSTSAPACAGTFAPMGSPVRVRSRHTSPSPSPSPSRRCSPPRPCPCPCPCRARPPPQSPSPCLPHPPGWYGARIGSPRIRRLWRVRMRVHQRRDTRLHTRTRSTGSRNTRIRMTHRTRARPGGMRTVTARAWLGTGMGMGWGTLGRIVRVMCGVSDRAASILVSSCSFFFAASSYYPRSWLPTPTHTRTHLYRPPALALALCPHSHICILHILLTNIHLVFCLHIFEIYIRVNVNVER